ncbi:MAG: 4-phospho-D-threonate 3-dehydrogenase, partial [Armatimonadetes bacterium]|nr:4-phospho-D-threonate 3-dehydrogenase [Armatimonadota bacterium]NIO74988.1 4-phospho-D-threonate 3-dehydrogenase [Armatimonadota bacterium]NIO95693.1 4-phospho-D-threonate 3-dehydrogenase [Armatimonadota bacterium]
MLIGVTMGDSSGVGPEIALKAYCNREIAHPIVVFGDFPVLEHCNELLGYGVPLRRVSRIDDVSEGFLNVRDLRSLKKEEITVGKPSKKSGMAAREYVVAATKAALDGDIAAVVTLPMNKAATQLSDPKFCGHTELIAELCQACDFTMMLATDELVVTHVSTHVSLADAVKQVKKKRISKVIELTYDALKRFIDKPRIAVLGLNPHAGEGGLFGSEEADEIEPAIEEAKGKGMKAIGPVPPDTAFYLAVRRGRFDGIVCMYHDQGHIPMKLLDFEGGVNITLG